jgi:hypothetical protein
LASLADLVPVARQLADELIEQIAIDLHARGRQISCQAGCSACCRYLIPVSPPEALAIWMGLLHLPGPRRERVMSRFLDVMRRIDHNPLPNMTTSVASTPTALWRAASALRPARPPIAPILAPTWANASCRPSHSPKCFTRQPALCWPANPNQSF